MARKHHRRRRKAEPTAGASRFLGGGGGAAPPGVRGPVGKPGKAPAGPRGPVGKPSRPPAPAGPRGPVGEPAPVHVRAPYAPTPTGKAAERRANAKRRRRHERKAVEGLTGILRDVGSEVYKPQRAYAAARYEGREPPEELKRTNPQAYARAYAAHRKYLSGHEGAKEDPAAELLLSTIATGGLGAGAKVGGRLGEMAVSRMLARGAGEEVASEAGALARAGRAVRRYPGRKVEEIKTAPARAGKRIRETPERIKAAPRKAKVATTTKEGRRALRRGAARTAARHPIRTGFGATAVTPPGLLPYDAEERARALLEGTGKAIVQNPLDTAGATGKGVVGIVTGPLALGAAGIKSAVEGTPAPLTHTAGEQISGIKEIGAKLLSGDPKTVQESVEHEVGVSPFIPAVALSRTKAWGRGRSAIRAGAADLRRRAAESKFVPGEERWRVAPEGVEQPVFKLTEHLQQRRRTKKRVQRENAPGKGQAAMHRAAVERALRKVPGTRGLLNRRGMEPGDVLQTVAEYGIRKPEDVQFVREHGPISETVPEGRVGLGQALDYLDEHPELFQNKNFQKAVSAVETASLTLPAALSGKGLRARLMGHAKLFNIMDPVDEVPIGAEPFTSATTREGAWAELKSRHKEAKQLRKDAVKRVREAERRHVSAEKAELKAQGAEGEVRGVAAERVKKRDRQILATDERYMKAVKRERAASKELTDARKARGNFERNKERLYPGESKPLVERVKTAEREARAAKANLVEEKANLRVRAESEAGKKAAGAVPLSKRAVKAGLDTYLPIADLERGPAGILNQLEARAARTLEKERRAAGTRAELQNAHAQARADREQAKALEELNLKLHQELRGYSRPGQALRAGSRRKYYDNPMLQRHAARVEAARRSQGLAPSVWTHHQEFREAADLSSPYPTAASRVEHMRSGKLLEHDLIDRSLRALMAGTIVAPRLRAGGQALARNLTMDEMLPVTMKDGSIKHLVTQKDWTHAVETGQYSPRHYTLLPYRQFKQAFLDPFMAADQKAMAGIAGQALKEGVKDASPDSKYVVIPKEVGREFEAQINPRHWHGEDLVTGVSKVTSRWLLASPAWAMIQSVAEAVPMVMARPDLLNPAYLAYLEHQLHKAKKLTPDETKAFSAIAGEAPATLSGISATRPELSANPARMFSETARAFTKNKIGQAIYSAVRLRPLVVFDAWRQGRYRELFLAAETDKRLNGWMGNLQGAMKIERKISDEIEGMPLHKQIAAVTGPRYRKDMDHLTQRLENVMGDWQSFSRYERMAAPFLVFYPFIRYSLKWPLTFAKQHPLSYSIANFLGQQNAQQLEKILGRAPSNPLAYAIPVWQDEQGQSHLMPTGARAAPGLSAPTQAIASQTPSQAVSALNPFLFGAPLTAATGIDPYSGRQEGERGWNAVDALMGTLPAARYFGLNSEDLRKVASKGLSEIGIGEPWKGEGPSAAKQTFDAIDKERQKRGLIEPWQGLTPNQFRETENASRDLALREENPIKDIFDNPDVGRALFGVHGKGGYIRGEKGPLEDLVREARKSKKAGERFGAMEAPFLPDEPKLTTRQHDLLLEGLKKLQGGKILVKPQESEENKLRRKLGLPKARSTEDLQKELGIEAPSTEDLRKSLGLAP